MMTANTAHSPNDIDVQIIQGQPPTIYIYRVDAAELQGLTSGSNPIPLAFSGIALGAFFSLLPSVVTDLAKLGSPSFSGTNLVYTVIDAIALVVGGIASTFAIRNASVVKTILADIKRRAD